MKTRILAFLGCFTIGMSCLADYQIPGNTGPILIANQLNNGGNSLDEVFGHQLPAGSSVLFWNCCDTSPTNGNNTCYSTYIYDPTDPNGVGPGAPLWYESDDSTPANPALTVMAPGRGVLLVPSGPVGFLTFHGTPNVPVLPVTLPCGFGQYNLLGRQTNGIGTYENVTGYAPQEGAQVLRLNPGGGNHYTTYTYTAGAWTPSTPSLNVGEAAFFLVPGDITINSTNMVVTSCSNTPVFYAPTATSSVCSNVTVICAPPSGSLFAPGTTNSVTCMATDCAGNSTTTNFTVTVLGPVVTITPMISISWSGGGQLQQADQLSGPWTDVPGGDVSPCNIPADARAKFYRVHCN